MKGLTVRFWVILWCVFYSVKRIPVRYTYAGNHSPSRLNATSVRKICFRIGQDAFDRYLGTEVASHGNHHRWNAGTPAPGVISTLQYERLGWNRHEMA